MFWLLWKVTVAGSDFITTVIGGLNHRAGAHDDFLPGGCVNATLLSLKEGQFNKTELATNCDRLNCHNETDLKHPWNPSNRQNLQWFSDSAALFFCIILCFWRHLPFL